MRNRINYTATLVAILILFMTAHYAYSEPIAKEHRLRAMIAEAEETARMAEMSQSPEHIRKAIVRYGKAIWHSETVNGPNHVQTKSLKARKLELQDNLASIENRESRIQAISWAISWIVLYFGGRLLVGAFYRRKRHPHSLIGIIGCFLAQGFAWVDLEKKDTAPMGITLAILIYVLVLVRIRSKFKRAEERKSDPSEAH